jgi:hypothetical protein
MKIRLAHALISLSILGAASCGIDRNVDRSLTKVPVIDRALDRTYVPNKGLVANLDGNGFPIRSGVSMDDTVVESRKFYDTLGSPNGQMFMTDYPDPFTGAPPSMKSTSPMTFEQWKSTFKIPERMPGENLEAYRARTDVVIYYNRNELGLGRELGCAEFDDGPNPAGGRFIGVACYVTNYGTAFRDIVNSLPLAVEGLHPKNTVCISYRPSAEPGYEVQFYTYNQDGDRREYAALDTLGPRPLPQVCMNCHGGSYDAEKHLAKHARFLPMDPNVVAWADAGPASRAAQEERIRKLNLLSTRSPLTSAQKVMLDQLYGGKLDVPNTVSANEWAPPAWDSSQLNRQLFDKVLKPNCTTCHAAMETAPDGKTLPIYDLFKTPELLSPLLSAQLCGGFTMPNSQATLLNFWEPSEITLEGKTYTSAADLMLSHLGMGIQGCPQFETVSDCTRAVDPDALCGNKYSGRACNTVTGECVPYMRDKRDPGEANGVCKTDGTRGCPFPQPCVPRQGPIPEGIEGYDGVCMP